MCGHGRAAGLSLSLLKTSSSSSSGSLREGSSRPPPGARARVPPAGKGAGREGGPKARLDGAGGCACWKMALVASAEGGAHVARFALRQRSESEARMLITTVRLSGWSGEVVLKSLAAWRAWSPGTMAPVSAGMGATPAAAASASCGMVRAWCSWADTSRGSVRTDIGSVRGESGYSLRACSRGPHRGDITGVPTTHTYGRTWRCVGGGVGIGGIGIGARADGVRLLRYRARAARGRQ